MDDRLDHDLPRWFVRFQDTVGLTLLLIADAYLLGTLMTLGWVRNIEDFGSWGWYRGVGVVIFFLAGISIAGVGIQSSITSGACFASKRYTRGVWLFLGSLVFTGIEVWASVSERSANFAPTPADVALIQVTGYHGNIISPTVLAVAIMLPFAGLFYGYSKQKRRKKDEIESPDDLKKRLENERIKAQYRRKIVGAYLGKAEPETPEEPADNPGANLSETEGETLDKPAIKSAGIAKDKMTASMLIEYVKQTYPGAELSEADAQEQIRILGAKERANNAPGQPYIASKRKCTAWAKKQFSSDKVTPIAARKRA